VVKRLKVFLRYQQQIGKIRGEEIAHALDEAVGDHAWRRRCSAIAQEWRPRFQDHAGAKEIAEATHQQLGRSSS
jgi:hypothetical protein